MSWRNDGCRERRSGRRAAAPLADWRVPRQSGPSLCFTLAYRPRPPAAAAWHQQAGDRPRCQSAAAGLLSAVADVGAIPDVGWPVVPVVVASAAIPRAVIEPVSA